MKEDVVKVLRELSGLLRESVLVTSVLALLMVATACYIWANGRELPANMVNLLMVIVAYFFGQRVESGKRAVLDAQARALEAGRK